MPAPVATAVSPTPGEILLDQSSPVVVEIVETVDGVNAATIVVTVNAVTAYGSSSFQNSWTGALLTRPQVGGGYRLVLRTPTPFPKNSQVSVTVNATSATGSVMAQFNYLFFVQIEQVTTTGDATVPRVVDTGPFQLAGTVSITGGFPNQVAGVGTSFLTQLEVGAAVTFGVDPTTYYVLSITDNLNFTLTANYALAPITGVFCFKQFLWIGYSREPGNIILRKTKGTGYTPEVTVVPGDDLSVSFDPNINKFILTYIHNGKVFLTTADVNDLPNTLVQTAILRTELRIGSVGDSPVGSDPGIVTFLPIKLVPPLETYYAQFMGDSDTVPVVGEYPKFPSYTFNNFPYASASMSPIANLPGTSATWRIFAPSGIDNTYKIGYNFIKSIGGVFSPPVFVPFSTFIPEYTEFTETAAPLLQVDAFYCLQVVIRDPSGNVRAGPIHGFYRHPAPPAFGVPDTMYSFGTAGDMAVVPDGGPTVVTFPPIKFSPPTETYYAQVMGDSFTNFLLSLTGFGQVGVG